MSLDFERMSLPDRIAYASRFIEGITRELDRAVDDLLERKAAFEQKQCELRRLKEELDDWCLLQGKMLALRAGEMEEGEEAMVNAIRLREDFACGGEE